MPRRFQFSLRALLAMVVLMALGITALNAIDNRTRGPTAFLLVEMCGACVGSAVGMMDRRPFTFGMIGAGLVLPVVYVARFLF